MVNLGMTRISSKGQVVIPANMRKKLKAGDNLVIIEDEDRIILKKADKMDEQLREDLEFAKRTEKAYGEIESGKFVSVDSKNLIEEMMNW